MIGRSALRLAAVGVGALTLSGCALLSSPDPAQLYRFGFTVDAPSPEGQRPAPLSVSIRRIEFPDAAKGERILGVTGNETAYIGGARWVTAAENLFDDDLRSAFASRADQIRVLNRGEPGTPPYVLQVTVTTFEARYAPGAQNAAPTVVVTARAQLRTTPERNSGGRDPPRAGRRDRTHLLHQPAGRRQPRIGHRGRLRPRVAGPKRPDRRLDDPVGAGVGAAGRRPLMGPEAAVRPPS